MKFTPFHSLVLVEKLNLNAEITSKTGIIMPAKHEGRFWKVKVLAVGPDVQDQIKPGFICMANPLPAIDDTPDFDNPSLRLMNSGNILGRWEDES